MSADTATSPLASLGLADPASAFAARSLADRVVLVALILLLFGAWHAMRQLADRGARVAFLAAAFAFVGALAARGAIVPCAFVASALLARAMLRRARRTSVAYGALGIAALVVAAFLPSSRPTVDAGGDPATETRAALERGNLFEARLWGERWVAEHPDEPAEPALLLAQIDWELGHRARARSIANDVAARASDDDLRRRAAAQLQQWKGAP